MEHRKIDIKHTLIRLAFSIIIILGIIIITYVLLDHFNLTNLTHSELQSKIEAFGALGPIVFIIISFLQVTFIPIPASITILCGNYLFGPWLSYLYSFIGIFSGSLFAFFLGKVIGRRFVNWIVGDKETVDYYLKKFKGKETIILFFMFLLPFFPDDILCSIAGIMPLSWGVFILIQIITRITTIGSTLFFMSGEIIPYDKPWGITILIILGILSIFLFILAYKSSDKINEKLINFVNKFSCRKDK